MCTNFHGKQFFFLLKYELLRLKNECAEGTKTLILSFMKGRSDKLIFKINAAV